MHLGPNRYRAAVIDAFKEVAAAKQDAERAENEATAYRNEVTQRAQGEAAQIIAASEAYKEEEIVPTNCKAWLNTVSTEDTTATYKLRGSTLLTKSEHNYISNVT